MWDATMGTEAAPFSTRAGLHCAEEASELSPGLGLEWRVTSFGNGSVLTNWNKYKFVGLPCWQQTYLLTWVAACGSERQDFFFFSESILVYTHVFYILIYILLELIDIVP